MSEHFISTVFIPRSEHGCDIQVYTTSAVVSVNGGRFRLQSADPDDLRWLAAALGRAADRLEDARKETAA